MATTEIKSLTGIRGVAAVAIVIYHYYNNWDLAGGQLSWSTFLYGITNKLWMFVDLFFILSAFVMCLSYGKIFKEKVRCIDYKEYLIKRFARIYPAYFLSVAIMTVYNISSFSLYRFLINITLLNILYKDDFAYQIVYWSLSAEFLLYFCFPFLFRMFAQSTRWRLGALLAAIVISLFIKHIYSFYLEHDVIRLNYNKGALNFGTNGLLRCLIDYVIGITFYLYRNYFSFLTKYGWLLLLLLILSFCGVNEIVCFQLLFGLLVVALLNGANIKILFENRLVYFLGLISYSLYLFHLNVLNAIKIIRPVSSGFDIARFIALIGSPIVSYLIFLLVERPVNRFLRRVLLRERV